MTITLINNKFVSKKDAKVPLYSDAFMRGYGIFETLRTHNNKELFRINDHLNRLFDSAKKIDLKIKHSKKEVLKMLLKVIKKSPHKIQRIKIIAIKEGIIISSVKTKIDPEIYKGVSVKSIERMREIPEVKSLSYISSFLSHEEAVKKGYFEAILVNEEEVYEGAYSNLFWFEANTLCTREKDVLPGITRKVVLELSPYKIKYKKIKLKDLLKKKEIFITQSVKGIVPVVKIDNKKIADAKVGTKTQEIMDLYRTSCITKSS